jgi:hypothetical protein
MKTLIQELVEYFNPDEFNTLIVEMPMLIDPVDLSRFNDLDTNKKIYDDYANRVKHGELKELQKITADIVLYDSRQTELLIGLDNLNRKVVYYMRYDVQSIPNHGKVGVQTIIWREKGDSAVTGLAKSVFFDYFLKKFGKVMTDDRQTGAGKVFWENRIDDAFKLKLYVYYVDLKLGEFKRLNNYSEFATVEMETRAWQKSREHETRRFIISEEEL